jgi:hypothetical protein
LARLTRSAGAAAAKRSGSIALPSIGTRLFSRDAAQLSETPVGTR